MASTPSSSKQLSLSERLAALQSETFNRRVPIQDLTSTEGHKILSLRRVNTAFGNAVVAEVQLNSEKVDTFLPKRYSKLLTDEDLKTMTGGEFFLKYEGMSGKAIQLRIFEKK